MPTKLFEKGKAPKSPGRPKGSGYRQAMEKALKEYGEKKFWRETFEAAKKEPSIRIVLVRKLVPDLVEQTFDDGLTSCKEIAENWKLTLGLISTDSKEGS